MQLLPGERNRELILGHALERLYLEVAPQASDQLMVDGRRAQAVLRAVVTDSPGTRDEELLALGGNGPGRDSVHRSPNRQGGKGIQLEVHRRAGSNQG